MTVEQQLLELEKQLEKITDFIERMELLSQIEDFKLKHNLIESTPRDYNQIDCIGCGS